MNINLTSLLPAQGRAFDKPDRQSLEAIFSQNSTTSLSVHADLGVAVGIDQTPLTLAYQAAIDRINEAVAPYLGENAIARGHKAEVDVSPQVTADRIVSRSTAQFSRFEDRHPDRDTEATVNHFVDTIRDGVEQGFAEAREILTGVGVLEGDIETNVDLTFKLVLDGLADFQSRLVSNLRR